MKNTLLVDFFTELSSTFSEIDKETFSSKIRLNPNHPVYKGHFEQVPIAPGVCLTQMIKEILMSKLNRDLFMESGDNIKFLALINPNENSEFEVTFSLKQNKMLEVSASITHNQVTFVKFKGKFLSL